MVFIEWREVRGGRGGLRGFVVRFRTGDFVEV